MTQGAASVLGVDLSIEHRLAMGESGDPPDPRVRYRRSRLEGLELPTGKLSTSVIVRSALPMWRTLAGLLRSVSIPQPHGHIVFSIEHR